MGNQPRNPMLPSQSSFQLGGLTFGWAQVISPATLPEPFRNPVYAPSRSGPLRTLQLSAVEQRKIDTKPKPNKPQPANQPRTTELTPTKNQPTKNTKTSKPTKSNKNAALLKTNAGLLLLFARTPPLEHHLRGVVRPHLGG